MKALSIVIYLFPSLLIGQDCSQYYPMKMGTKYSLSTYDKKGTETNQTINEVIDFKDEGSSSKATIQTTLKDLKKGKNTSAQFHVTCEGDKVTLDINDMLRKKMEDEMEGKKDVSVEIVGVDPVYSNDLKAGQTLPDARSEIKVSSGSTTFNFHAYSTNRKVVGNESITTPAGTFNCIVITMDTDTKTLLSKSGSSKEWLADGVGVVRHEEYNKSGKLVSYQVLTSFD